MNTPNKTIDEIESIIRDTSIAITASEGWAKSYLDTPEYFKRLLAIEADMEKLCRDYLRQLSTRIASYVAWSQYHQDIVAVKASDAPVDALEAYDVSVLFDGDGFQEDEQTQIEGLIREIYVNGIALGYIAQRAQATGKTTPIVNTPGSPIYEAIQNEADQHVKQLAEWLDATTAKEVVQSIQESIALGENQELAVQRLMRLIDDPIRAERIARTEAVRAYAIGERRFALRNGATSKTWEALPGADNGGGLTPCLDNDGVTVDILDAFPSGDEDRPAHPNCRCKVNYNYPDGQVIDDV